MCLRHANPWCNRWSNALYYYHSRGIESNNCGPGVRQNPDISSAFCCRLFDFCLLFACLFVCLFVCTRLFVCLFVCLYKVVCLFVCLFVFVCFCFVCFVLLVCLVGWLVLV